MLVFFCLINKEGWDRLVELFLFIILVGGILLMLLIWFVEEEGVVLIFEGNVVL